MIMNEIELAKYINASEPLNRFRNSKDIKEKIEELSIEQKTNLLIFSFQNYDKSYNVGLCLTYTILWSRFNEATWKKLILEMFPRKVKFEERNVKETNTGSYFDIFLLNGIVGISPFEFIFQEPRIDETEKKRLIDARIGQGDFRKRVLISFNR